MHGLLLWLVHGSRIAADAEPRHNMQLAKEQDTATAHVTTTCTL